jgi:hypothetical protein
MHGVYGFRGLQGFTGILGSGMSGDSDVRAFWNFGEFESVGNMI